MQEKHWAEFTFITFFHDLLKVEARENLSVIKDDMVKKLTNIEDKDLKMLCVLVADEFLVGLLGSAWCDFFLEVFFFDTCVGGKTFFDNLDKFIKQKNLPMIKLYILAIKFGFAKHNETAIKKYSEISEKLFALQDAPVLNIPYKFKRREAYTQNIFYVLVPVGLVLLANSLWEFFLIKTMHSPLKEASDCILKEVL